MEDLQAQHEPRVVVVTQDNIINGQVTYAILGERDGIWNAPQTGRVLEHRRGAFTEL